MKVIAVFGSSRPRPGGEGYAQAQAVGRLLAEAGYAVATGGYAGTMEATSRGAAEAGGHVIGVTTGRMVEYRGAQTNAWVEEEIAYKTLQERVLHLVTQNDGMIALPGGIGTLSEMSLAWSFLQVGEIPPRPLVLLGQIWVETLDAFIRPEYLSEAHAGLLSYANDPAGAVDVIKQAVPL